MEDREHISVTQVGMILRCPVSWWWRYKLGVKTPPGWAMVGGSALDEVLNTHHLNRINGTPDPYLPDLYRVVLDRVSQEKQPQGEVDYDYHSLGPVAVETYLREADPFIYPRAVQTELYQPLEGVPVLGYIDLEHGRDHIVIADHKFSNRKKIASTSLQLAVYDTLHGAGPRQVQMITVVKNKKPKIEFDNYFVTEADRAAATRQVVTAWKLTRAAIAANDPGILPMADPEGWNCSEKWCGYWSRCRGSRYGVPQWEE